MSIILKHILTSEEAKRQSLVSGSDIKVVQNGTVLNGKSVNGTGSDSEEDILTYRLKIHDADVKDAGKWKCEVKDKYGTASTSCDLDVYGIFLYSKSLSTNF